MNQIIDIDWAGLAKVARHGTDSAEWNRLLAAHTPAQQRQIVKHGRAHREFSGHATRWPKAKTFPRFGIAR